MALTTHKIKFLEVDSSCAHIWPLAMESDGYRGSNVRVMLIIDDFKIGKLIIKNRIRFAFNDELRERVRGAAELQFHLRKMIGINVAIAACPDKFTDV